MNVNSGDIVVLGDLSVGAVNSVVGDRIQGKIVNTDQTFDTSVGHVIAVAAWKRPSTQSKQ